MKKECMKKYETDTVINAIEAQIAEKKIEAMHLVDESSLEIAQKIMEANPGSYYFIEEFEQNDHLITALRINQVLSVLNIDEKGTDKGDEIESIIKYTQLVYARNEILLLEKQYEDSDTDMSVFISKYSDIDNLTPVTNERYFFESLYFCICYNDENEEIIYKICPETFSYHIRQIED